MAWMLQFPFVGNFLQRLNQVDYARDVVDDIVVRKTPYMLVFFSIAVASKQYFGTPMKCFTPREFSGTWDVYTEEICFIEHNYFVPMNETITDAHRGREMTFYRWVPMMLVLQAFFYNLSAWAWYLYHSSTEAKPASLVSECLGIDMMCREGRISSMKAFSSILVDVTANVSKKYIAFAKVRMAFAYGGFKLLNLVLIAIQFGIFTVFLGADSPFWGFQALNSSFAELLFPRLVMCDFEVRNVGYNIDHSVECIIMLNMINEIIYIFLYFWHILVFLMALVNFYLYVSRMFFFRNTFFPASFINKHNSDKKLLSFVDKFLDADGILILYFAQLHWNGMISFAAFDQLWETFNNENAKKTEPTAVTVSPAPLLSIENHSPFSEETELSDSGAYASYMESGTLRASQRRRASPEGSPKTTEL